MGTVITTDIVKSGSTVHSQKFRGYADYTTSTDNQYLTVFMDFGMCVTDTGTWSSSVGWNISVSDSVGGYSFTGSLSAAERSGTAPKYWKANTAALIFERRTSSYTTTVTLTATSATQSAYTATKTFTISIPALPTYTVSYNANGGSGGPSSQTAYAGIPLRITSSTPYKLHYVTDYWTDSQYNNYYPDYSYEFTANTTLTAHWTFNQQSITVKYNRNGQGGSAPSSTTASNSSDAMNTYTFTAASAMAETDTHVFSGWATSPSGAAIYSADQPVYYTYASEPSTYTLTLYAVWTEKVSYLVTFNNHGHGTAPAAQSVISGQKATNPGSLTDDGWAFKGWYTTSSYTTQFNFNTAITQNTEIHAKWVEKYDVTFESNGHGSAPESQSVESGTYVTRPTDPTASGWQFSGWFKEQGCANEWDFSSDTVTQAISLWAKWVPLYTVGFNLQGHGSSITPQTVAYGGHVTRPTDPTAQDYTFAGWYEDSACTNTWNFNTEVVTGDMTLWAKWVEPSFTFSFNMMGHGTQIEPRLVPINTATTEPTEPTAEGYVFGGWYTSAYLLIPFDFSTLITEDTTVYAKWTGQLSNVYIGISGLSKRIAKAYIGVDGQARRITKGYIGVNGEARPFGGTASEPTYTVTFDVQGHGTAPAQYTNVQLGSTIPEPDEPTETGCTFHGWYKESECTNEWDFDIDLVVENTTLYAMWTTLTTFTITFNANGGTGDVPPTMSKEMEAYNTEDFGDITSAKPTKSGYLFVGWNQSGTYASGYSRISYSGIDAPDGTYSITTFYDWSFYTYCNNTGGYTTGQTTLNLKAVWAEEPPTTYTVTFNMNGHGTQVSSQTVESGGLATQPTAPTETGYSFGGWYTEQACTNAFSFSTPITSDRTLYAKWEVSDLAGTSWLINESPTLITKSTYINFTSDGRSGRTYTRFRVSSSSQYIRYYYNSSSSTTVYDDGAWYNDGYRTIHIIDGSTDDDALIAWLIANATQIV